MCTWPLLAIIEKPGENNSIQWTGYIHLHIHVRTITFNLHERLQLNKSRENTVIQLKWTGYKHMFNQCTWKTSTKQTCWEW